MSSPTRIAHHSPNQHKGRPSRPRTLKYDFPVPPPDNAVDPDFIGLLMNRPRTELLATQPSAKIVGNHRRFNTVILPDVDVPKQFHVSANPLHQRGAWAAFLDANAPLAQYIATFRGRRRESIQRMEQVVNALNSISNCHLLGSNWRRPRFKREQIAIVGVVEGTYAAKDIHMHLCFYSRSQLFDSDMEVLKQSVVSRGIGKELWFKGADPDLVNQYHNYILKGFAGPSGASFASRVLWSRSFATIR